MQERAGPLFFIIVHRYGQPSEKTDTFGKSSAVRQLCVIVAGRQVSESAARPRQPARRPAASARREAKTPDGVQLNFYFFGPGA